MILQSEDGQFIISASVIQIKEMYVVQKGNTGLIKKTVVDHDVIHTSYDSLNSLEQGSLSVNGT